MANEKYWASEQDSDIMLGNLNTQLQQYYKWLMNSNRKGLWATSYNQFNATLQNGAYVNYTGSRGEYKQFSVNQFRSVIQRLLTLTINDRPAFDPRSSNTDSVSQKQTVLARGLLDYYMREKELEVHLRQSMEYAALYGEGFVSITWDTTQGEEIAVDPDTNMIQREGDIAYSSYEPIDVARDVTLRSATDATWWMVRDYVNRYDLIVEYPEKESEIMKAPKAWTDSTMHFAGEANLRAVGNNDLVEVWQLYHDRTTSMPNGRYVRFLNNNGILLDTDLPYKAMPLKRLSPADIGGQPFGYGMSFDLLPIQDSINTLYSIITTNQQAFGVQNIAVPKGSNMEISQVSEGMTLIEYDQSVGGGKPEAMNFTQTAPEIFAHLEKLENVMKEMAGLNSTVFGQPPSGQMSGAALALLASTATQFAQGLQFSYVRQLEQVGTATIQTLRDYALTKRVVDIVGISNRSNLESFTGEDLSSISRVQVDVGNPLMRTTAGKLTVADKLLEMKMITQPQEYLQLIATGNLQVMTEGPVNELLAIKAENEDLGEGRDVIAVITDNHRLHISEHRAVLSDPAARRDPAKLQAVLAHLSEHIALLQDPNNIPLLMALGQEPIQAPEPAPNVPGAGQGAPGPNLKNPPGEGIPSQVEASMPNMPRLPVNPATGDRVQPPQGPM